MVYLSKLTRRQQEIYEFIKDKIESRGYGPTVREIGDAFEIKSPNGVICYLNALVIKGLIVRKGSSVQPSGITDDQPPDTPRSYGEDSSNLCDLHAELRAREIMCERQQARVRELRSLLQQNAETQAKPESQATVEALEQQVAVMKDEARVREGFITDMMEQIRCPDCQRQRSEWYQS
jgi:SOS-response transcriptional repressor LexA